jgi:hypothetical protein
MSTVSAPAQTLPLPMPAGVDAAAPGSEPKLPDAVKGLLAALGGVAVAVITLLAAFGVVKWSSTQTGLATTEAAAVVGFLTACVAHFWPWTQKEPVAVGGTFTALIATTLAVLSGFNVWTLSEDEISALVGLVTAVLAIGTALFARGQVTANKQPADSQPA